MASVVTRKRGILRRCAPQDDNLFVILSGTTWSEESRACAFARHGDYARVSRRGRGTRRNGAPSRRALRNSNIPLGGQSKACGTGAHCAPLRGGTRSPPCCNGRWVAAVLRDNAFTRAARPEGKGVDSQEGENRRCSPSCAQCGRAGRVPARDARALPHRLSRRIPPPHLAGALPCRTSPSRRWRGDPPPLKGEAGWVVQPAIRGHFPDKKAHPRITQG